MKVRKTGIRIAAGILLTALILCPMARLLPTRVSAASSSEIRTQINALEDQKAAIQAQMAELEQQIDDTVSEMKDIVEKKNNIDQQVFLLHEQIANLNEQISAYRVLIADKQEELDAAEGEYQALQDKYRERVRAMEEEGTLSYWSVLFKANSFADLLDRLNMIEEIAAADQRRLRELNDAAQRVAEAQATLEEEKEASEEAKAELADSEADLEEKRAEADALLQELVAKGEEYQAYMADAEEEQNQIMMEIAAQEAAYNEAVEREYWATYVPPTTTASATGASDSGNDGGSNGGDSSGSDSQNNSGSSSTTWLTPVPYYTLTSPFGMRIHPIYKVWKMHNGVDLACAQGTQIYASRSGTVTTASYNDSCGFYVSINHGDGYSSIYMHMTHYIVSAGQSVSAGQVIGYVGDTGASTGYHLHFGISYNGSYVNPMDYI